jgi:hypothetical protein
MCPFLLGKVINVPSSRTFPVKIHEAPSRSEVLSSLVNVDGMEGLDNAIQEALMNIEKIRKVNSFFLGGFCFEYHCSMIIQYSV